MSQAPFRIHHIGNWSRSQVQINYRPAEYILPGDFPRRAMEFWKELTAREDRHLFNGALCRLENFSKKIDALHLSVSRTCYRDLLFSNAHTDELLRALGELGPVRALGISVVIETVDGYLPIIRRSEHVGEGPGGLDVIGGHVHPDEHARDDAPDVFCAIADEVNAELGIPPNLLDNFICCGLAENWPHRKPELIFFLALPLAMNELRPLTQNAREANEFTDLLAVRADKESLQRFVKENESRITASALACLQIYESMKN
jgi:hypothetical protein